MVFSSHYMMLMKWNYSIVFGCIVEQGICDEPPFCLTNKGEAAQKFQKEFSMVNGLMVKYEGDIKKLDMKL